MENNQLFEVALDIQKQVGEMGATVAAIEADLKEHMRRTRVLETEVKWLHKQSYIAYGAIAIIILAVKYYSKIA
jgi:regulator of replication initiation timing